MLLNVLFVITEVRVFLAYMSVFHMIYIFLFLIDIGDSGVTWAITYLVIYCSLMIFFFFILFLVKNKDIIFLSDLAVYEQLGFIGGFLINAIAGMGGVPPFLSFWLKIELVNTLLGHDEIVTAIIVLGVGLYLMYFYLQNYRFIGNLKFNWGYTSVCARKEVVFIYVAVVVLFMVNILGLFFINDFVNWHALIRLFIVLE